MWRHVMHCPCGCRVGNELGAGRPRNARMVVFATLTITPVLWAVIACILAEPHLQRALLHLYVDGSDEVLWNTLRQLLTIVAVIELADALQTVLGGVVQVICASLLACVSLYFGTYYAGVSCHCVLDVQDAAPYLFALPKLCVYRTALAWFIALLIPALCRGL